MRLKDLNKILVVVSEDFSIDLLLSCEILKSWVESNESLYFITFNYNHLQPLEEKYKKNDHKFFYFRTLLSNADIDFIDDQSYRLSRTWFSDKKFLKYVTYNSVIIPEILELKYASFFINIFTSIRVLSKIGNLDTFKSAIIFSNNKIQSKCFNAFLTTHNIKVLDVYVPVENQERKHNKQKVDFVKKIAGYLSPINKYKGDLIIYQPHFSVNPIIEELEKNKDITAQSIYDLRISFLLLLKYKVLKLFPFLRHLFGINFKFPKAVIHQIASDKSFNYFTCFDNFNWLRYLQDDFLKIWNDNFIDICKSIDSINYIIKEYGPRIFITSTYVTEIQRIIFALAKRKDIPTLAMLHGLLSLKRRSSDIIYSDFLAIWGPEDKNIFEQINKSNIGKCIIAGNPLYDKVFSEYNLTDNSRNAILTNFNIPAEKKIVLFVSNYAIPSSAFDGVDTIEWGVKLVYNYAENHLDKDIFLVIKRHPLDKNDAFYLNFEQQKFSHNVAVTKNYSYYDLVSACDVLLTFPFSTAGLDAIANSKPFLLIKLFDFPHEIPYIKYRTTEYANSSLELKNKINLFLDVGLDEEKKENYSRFFSDFSGFSDNKSAVRIASFIRKQLN